jgi:hypothetical protein
MLADGVIVANLLAVVPFEESRSAEVEWIERLVKDGAKLINHQPKRITGNPTPRYGTARRDQILSLRWHAIIRRCRKIGLAIDTLKLSAMLEEGHILSTCNTRSLETLIKKFSHEFCINSYIPLDNVLN